MSSTKVELQENVMSSSEIRTLNRGRGMS